MLNSSHHRLWSLRYNESLSTASSEDPDEVSLQMQSAREARHRESSVVEDWIQLPQINGWLVCKRSGQREVILIISSRLSLSDVQDLMCHVCGRTLANVMT